MKKLLTLGLAPVALLVFSGLGVTPGLAKGAFAAHCWCKVIQYIGDDAGTNITDPFIDFGQVATYNTQFNHNKDCADKCSKAASNDANFNNKTWWCQQIKVRGHHRLVAYSMVGVGPVGQHYRIAQSIEFDCKGGVETCTCPAGWTSNTSGQLGGVTTDHKCKKVACQANTIAPYPPDGTPIGSWGFSWGNAFIAWGTSANGGAPNCITTPWEGY